MILTSKFAVYIVLYIYPKSESEIADPGREREQGRFRGSTERAGGRSLEQAFLRSSA